MDLTSAPLSPWNMSDRQRVQLRCNLAASADLFRMQQNYIKAEKLYLEAAKVADGNGAVAHFMRLAGHCRDMHNAKKSSK